MDTLRPAFLSLMSSSQRFHYSTCMLSVLVIRMLNTDIQNMCTHTWLSTYMVQTTVSLLYGIGLCMSMYLRKLYLCYIICVMH